MWQTLFLLAVDTYETGLPRVDGNEDAVKTIVTLVFGVLGSIAVLIITIAGTQYVISQGDPQKTAKAKNTIIYALVGLVISLLAYAIVNYVVLGVSG